MVTLQAATGAHRLLIAHFCRALKNIHSKFKVFVPLISVSNSDGLSCPFLFNYFSDSHRFSVIILFLPGLLYYMQFLKESLYSPRLDINKSFIPRMQVLWVKLSIWDRQYDRTEGKHKTHSVFLMLSADIFKVILPLTLKQNENHVLAHR